MVSEGQSIVQAGTELRTVPVQSILYDLALENIERSLEYLDNAARVACNAGICGSVSVAYGDCSPARTIDHETLSVLSRKFSHLARIEYEYFAANLGSAAGQNRLLKSADFDFLMILNPDVLASPKLIVELMGAIERPGVGLVEARQLPIEHPKDYDPITGETSWASTACAFGRTALFCDLKGFDAETFFLYCDDVDFSWRVRLAGHKVVLHCAAVVFHDKRLSHQGGWVTSAAERYYSAEAGLLLPYKYSRADLTEQYLDYFENREKSIFKRPLRASSIVNPPGSSQRRSITIIRSRSSLRVLTPFTDLQQCSSLMAKSYEHEYLPLSIYGNVVSLLRDLDPRAGVHVDVGCGYGAIAEPIRDELRRTYIGFDLAEDGLDVLRARGFEVRSIDLCDPIRAEAIVREAVGDRPIASLTFIDTLEHITNGADVIAMFATSRRRQQRAAGAERSECRSQGCRAQTIDWALGYDRSGAARLYPLRVLHRAPPDATYEVVGLGPGRRQ